MRLLISTLVLALVALPCAARAEAVLQPDVTVTGNTIRIGDLFSGAGASATDPVAPAPALGTRVTFNAAWLGAVAREHHVDWQPNSNFDQASVERASRVIGADAIAQAILAAAVPPPEHADAAVQLDNPGLRLLAPAEDPQPPRLDGLELNPRSGRFSAYVSAAADPSDAARKRVTGRIIYEVKVPVPRTGMAVGAVFGRNDIAEVEMPRDRIAADTITDPRQLIGMAARHILSAGAIVRAGDVQAPLVVHKGDLVTIELDTLRMQLTAQGTALEDGAMGAAIRVANTQSKRVIDASVAGPNRVVIGGGAQLAARP